MGGNQRQTQGTGYNCFNPLPRLQLSCEPSVGSENILRTKVSKDQRGFKHYSKPWFRQKMGDFAVFLIWIYLPKDNSRQKIRPFFSSTFVLSNFLFFRWFFFAGRGTTNWHQIFPEQRINNKQSCEHWDLNCTFLLLLLFTTFYRFGPF